MTTSAHHATQVARLGSANPLGYTPPTLAHLLNYANDDSFLLVKRSLASPSLDTRWHATLTINSRQCASGLGATPQDAINELELALVHIDPRAAEDAYNALWDHLLTDPPCPLPTLPSRQPNPIGEAFLSRPIPTNSTHRSWLSRFMGIFLL